MEETEMLMAANHMQQEPDLLPHTPSSVSKQSSLLPSHLCTPNDRNGEVPMQLNEGQSLTATVDNQAEKAATLTAANDDISKSCWQATKNNNTPWSLHPREAWATPRSTLNPEAKEFKLPSGKADDSFASSVMSMNAAAMLHMPLMCNGGSNSGEGGGAPLAIPLFAVPSMTVEWRSTTGVMCEPAFAPAGGVTCEAVFAPAAKPDRTRWPPPPSRHAGAPVTPRTLAGLIMEDYAEECRSTGCHMVAVFNLEPRTTQEELLSIFFPMGAKKAELLPPHRSPRPNRRAGVVFFSSKAFAAVAVEKLHDFVPNRQHQPLRVQYCGPDASETVTRETSVQSTTSPHSLPSSTRYSQPQQTITTPAMVPTSPLQPWRLPAGAQLDRIHEEMWLFVKSSFSSYQGVLKHVVAVHGLDRNQAQNVLNCNFLLKGAERYEMWPAKACGFVSSPMLCNGVSALVFYSQEVLAKNAVAWFQQWPPEGQAQPIDVVYLNGLAFASSSPATGSIQSCSDIQETNSAHGSVAQASTTSLAVTPVSPSHIAVFDKIDAYFMREYGDPNLYLVGVHNLLANTDKKALFRLLAPHGALDAEMYPGAVSVGGEVRSSGVAFFDNEAVARKTAEKLHNFAPFKQPFPVVARYLLKPVTADVKEKTSSTAATAAEVVSRAMGGARPDPFLSAVAEELYAPIVNADQLTEKMVQLMERPETTQEVAGQLASVINDTLTAMKHHAVKLSTPLVHALLGLHEKLNIPRRKSKDPVVEAEVQEPVVARNILLMQIIARALMNLLMDNSKPHESRMVAAVLCGYLFQYSYLMKSPYELAVKLIVANEKSLDIARDHRKNGQNATIPVTIVELEEEEQKPWVTLMQCLEQMTSLWRQYNKSRAKKDPFRKEFERRANDFFQRNATSVGGTSSSLNTSTRPTPRRVVAKVTPGTGSGCSNSSPGLTQASPVAPRVDLGTFVDTSGYSNDMSMESNPSVAMVPMSFMSDPSAVASLLVDKSRPVLNVLSQQQQKDQQQQQQRIPITRPNALDMASAMESTKPPPGLRTFGTIQGVYTHAELMERTVYITKLPATLRRSQFRRLLLHFGEFNKVRLCRDDHQFQSKTEANGLTAGEPPVALWFSFVEFAEQSSAKAMIEYFRNTISNPQPFGFLLDNTMAWPDASRFTVENIQALLNVRTSPARNPIHDQLPLDAILTCAPQQPKLVLRNRPCHFGLEGGESTLDTGADATSMPPLSQAALSNLAAGRYTPGSVTMTVAPASATASRTPTTTTAAAAAAGTTDPCLLLAAAAQTAERTSSDAVEDDMEFHSIMNAVVPSAPSDVWGFECARAAVHSNDHLFDATQVPWLKSVATEGHGGGVWATDAGKAAFRAYVAPLGNPLIEDDEDSGSD
ncbi:putative RNA-binding protein [Trypanosoma grayi]|uniref:putative RNA-binding protein n=1 Tax=Trypanosoma grayi TaxID=71804 RepID=UPI0004F42408|nr:putative RNA-binding protein [Trypanosoma grayi]KEG08661.1 putative RNA-binding protein [Trypanosoma grayi]